eukprot:CAMPEP_0178986840 /NCGR_PEP_ID=MMETSP0795-20121207/2927_1 /TAXON_ID=88552 /ORGANISM="Amoebophrya sp., Strain Ameob2" /LENGTH=380 /DNA_ID=CAMNT_0020677945 /DNA_START=310 /DNA_END=1452 /DNA_ORIENTATION=-
MENTHQPANTFVEANQARTLSTAATATAGGGGFARPDQLTDISSRLLLLSSAAAAALLLQQSGLGRRKEVECEVAGNIGKTNWDNVRRDVVALLDDERYIDEPVGPILVRLAWHSSGTWCTSEKKGGSDGATMRFTPEAAWGANAGLDKAREVVAPLLQKYPNASVSDMWIFCGTVAIEEMSGNKVKIGFKEGRTDRPSAKSCPMWKTKTCPDGRLPDADMGNMGATAKHLRTIFHRQGFNDQEIVALSGAHGLGRCHTTSSGYDGPWSFNPTMLTNEYYRLLKEEKWTLRKWSGPEQYQDATGELMMLPSDIALIIDPEFKKWVDIYHRDEERFYKDFGKACKKLFENGVPFKSRHGLGMLGGLFSSVPELGKPLPEED